MGSSGDLFSRASALVLAGAVLCTASATGAAAQCRLALVLAQDVSSSVDDTEYVLQRDGLAAALNDPDIRSAILQGGTGHVAVSIFEWSGRNQSVVVQDWIALDSDAQIDGVIARLRARSRSHAQFPTALGYALGFASTLLAKGPECLRKVVDVSGDGVTNDGFGPRAAYRHFPFTDVTVNGLAILGADPEVERYFDTTVRRGPLSFVETSDGYPGYRRAMTRKLYRELNDLIIGQADTQPPKTVSK